MGSRPQSHRLRRARHSRRSLICWRSSAGGIGRSRFRTLLLHRQHLARAPDVAEYCGSGLQKFEAVMRVGVPVHSRSQHHLLASGRQREFHKDNIVRRQTARENRPHSSFAQIARPAFHRTGSSGTEFCHDHLRLQLKPGKAPPGRPGTGFGIRFELGHEVAPASKSLLIARW